MRTRGSALELERRRRLAVERVQEGYSAQEVADFLGVHERTVRKWKAAYLRQGERGLAAKAHPGRSPKLPRHLQGLLLGWLRHNPRSFGFATELWTGARVAQLIARHFGVRYHPRYLNAWLTDRGFSSQKPASQPRERDDAAIQHWARHDWPRLQNGRAANGPIWC